MSCCTVGHELPRPFQAGLNGAVVSCTTLSTNGVDNQSITSLGSSQSGVLRRHSVRLLLYPSDRFAGEFLSPTQSNFSVQFLSPTHSIVSCTRRFSNPVMGVVEVFFFCLCSVEKVNGANFLGANETLLRDCDWHRFPSQLAATAVSKHARRAPLITHQRCGSATITVCHVDDFHRRYIVL